MSTYACAMLERAGVHGAGNRARLMSWWERYERALGAPPDVRAHLVQLRRGLRLPVVRSACGERLALRPVGQARC